SLPGGSTTPTHCSLRTSRFIEEISNRERFLPLLRADWSECRFSPYRRCIGLESGVSDKILNWRPRAPEKQLRSVEYPLWSMHKQQARIDCSIHDCADKGWKLVLLINQEWSVTCPFIHWTDAITAADDKHAEL